MHAHPRRRVVALLVALTLVLLGAACGGDDDGGDEATGASSTTEATSTTSEGTATTEADGGGDGASSDVCDAAQRLSDLDDESQGAVNESLQQVLAPANSGDQAAADAALDQALDDMRAFIDERLPDVLDAYDDLAATVPDDLRADVVLIRDFTEDLVRAIADVHTVEEMQAVIADRQDEINKVTEAVVRLDRFTQEECDIALAD